MNNGLKRYIVVGILVTQDRGWVGPESWSRYQSFIDRPRNSFPKKPTQPWVDFGTFVRGKCMLLHMLFGREG